MSLAPHMAKGEKYRKETLPLFFLGEKYRKETLPLFFSVKSTGKRHSLFFSQ